MRGGSRSDMDVAVVGAGPAGRALAAACAARGLATVLVDRNPDAPWSATYGSWVTDLPDDLPPGCVAAEAAGFAIARTRHELARRYAVLDTAELRAHLDDRLAAGQVELRAGRAVRAVDGRLVLAGGDRIGARWIVDAGGHRQPLTSRPRTGAAAEQTAYGIVVPAATAAPIVPPGSALFMDWRPDHGAPGAPTFLYGVPLGQDTVLLEETSLARRPGLPLRELRDRLAARLAAHGVDAPLECAVERVRFPLDVPRHREPGVVGFGAAAPFVHPASGFNLAATLAAVPRLADALASGRRRAARRAVWPASAIVVHRVRRIGLEALLRMPPEQVPAFFETFFALPERHQHAYLSERAAPAATAVAMAALFARADMRLRMRLVGPALLPSAQPVGPNSR
ncbi:lycopene cyclase family protein [Pseudonocardia sp. CA-107938]|uniref:lycopene cyclase family protein n=1 Tax=Pseudonocardia sp. CA-107938 TaxID=3240021 RepID=UPI003D94927B